MEKIYTLQLTPDDLCLLGVALLNLKSSYEELFCSCEDVGDTANASYWSKCLNEVNKICEKLHI